MAKANPSYAYVGGMIAECYRLMGKYDLAKEEYRKDIDRNPLGSSRSKIGILKIDTALEPNNADLWFALGTELKIYSKEEEFNEAINAFKKVIEIDSSYPEAHYELGQLYEKSIYNGSDLFLAKDEYLTELQHNPASQRAKSSVERVTEKIKNRTESRETDISLFEGIKFPQRAVIVRENAEIFDGSFSSLERISKESEVTVEGIYRRTVRMKEGDFRLEQVFYIISNTFNGAMEMDVMGLINTKDVALKTTLNNPWYKFLNTGASIAKSPIGRIDQQGRMINKYFLWLRAGNEYKFLGEYKENWVCNEELSVSVSPDGKYAFIIGANTALSTDGGAIHNIPYQYHSSPLWDGDKLFLRQVEYGDSVQFMKPQTGEMWPVIYLQEGTEYYRHGNDRCIMKPPPIEFENGLIKMTFQRKGSNPSDPHKNCMTVTVLATKEREIVKKDKKWDICD